MNMRIVCGVFAASAMALMVASNGLADRGGKGRSGGVAGSACTCVGDIDNNGTVDGADLGLLLADWGTNNPSTNLDGSGVVDGADLGLLLAAWGPCSTPPPNDSCSNATSIDAGIYEFCTVNATSAGPDACSFAGSAAINHDIWYIWSSNDNGTLTVSTCGLADFDTKLAIYGSFIQGLCPCPTGGIGLASLLACDDDTVGCPGNSTKLTVNVSPGNCYLIRVGGFGNAVGSGVLEVEFEPTGDDCGTCIQLPTNNISLSVNGTTAGNTAYSSFDITSCGGSGDKIDEWYCYTVPCAGDVRIDTFGSELDTVLSVFTGTCGLPEFADDITQIACNDDYDFNENGSINPPEERASLVFLDDINFNTKIFIRVAGWNNTTGNYKLNVICTTCCGGSSVTGCFPFGACENCVCEQDPFCCNTQWDGSCAGAADSNPCDDVCPCDK